MRVRIVLAVLASVVAGATQVRAGDTPESVVSAFCAAHAAAAVNAHDPLLSPSLKQLIADAWTKNGEYEAAHPGDKPPLGDGIQFQAYPDWAPICRPGAVSSGVTDTTVDVEYVFPDTEGSDWTDRLVLLVEGDRLLIDDVLYGSEQFNLGLRAVLQSIVDGKF
jgi:hypothetical protein